MISWFRHITLALLLLSSLGMTAQGWERTLSGGGQDQANAIANTHDGGYILTGAYSAFNLYLAKTDADGQQQWFRPYSYAPGAVTTGYGITVTPEGDYIIVGAVRLGGPTSQSDFFVLKTDPTGQVLWAKPYGQNRPEVLRSVELLDDGRISVCGVQQQSNGKDKLYTAMLASNGIVLWEKTFGTTQYDEKGYAHFLATNGEIVYTGEQGNGPDKDVYVVRTSVNGDSLWTNSYGFDFVPSAPASDVAYSIVESTNGAIVLAGLTTSVQGQLAGLLLEISASGDTIPNWYKTFPKTLFYGIAVDGADGYYISGYEEVSNTFEDLYLLRADENGDKVWDTHIGKGGPDYGYAVTLAHDGGVVSAGSSSPSIFATSSSAYIVKADAQGQIFTNYIQGNVFHDLNLNCANDGSEPPLKEWIIRIESPNLLRFATTDEFGNYEAPVDTGAYTIEVFATNALWESCQAVYQLSMTQPYDTLIADFPIQVANACPRNEVSVNVPFLRRCAENTYTVRYCNTGTLASTNTQVEIALDTFLTLTNSSIPFSSQSGNTYTFLLGFVEHGTCGEFTFDAFLDCDSTILGQTHCVDAHIFPDSFCTTTSNWDGSDIVAEASCENGQVKMSLRNKGSGNMNGTQDFVIIEDLVMLTDQPQPFVLLAGQDSTVFSTPANGKTYRVIAEQSPNYPGLSMPTAAVEGCATDTTTNISLGYFTMFPQDDDNPFIASECQESKPTNFNLPNFKRGYPKGYDAERYVSTETDLQYLIRFQNTGVDTVEQVMIIDTLSTFLDPTTVRPGAASHPFTMEVYGDGILRLAIPTSGLLPFDSSATEADNSGFVSFRVSQKPDLACGTEILNSAAIFFDFQAPVITSETFHTVCDFDDFITVHTTDIFIENVEVKVYPNPFLESVTFDIENAPIGKEYRLELYTSQGHLFSVSTKQQPIFRLYRPDIPSGLLFYRLTCDGRPVAFGELLKM